MPLPEKVAFIFVFGIGTQEMVIIGLLFLVIFGPSKLPGMARDLGRFVSGAIGTSTNSNPSSPPPQIYPHRGRGPRHPPRRSCRTRSTSPICLAVARNAKLIEVLPAQNETLGEHRVRQTRARPLDTRRDRELEPRQQVLLPLQSRRSRAFSRRSHEDNPSGRATLAEMSFTFVSCSSAGTVALRRTAGWPRRRAEPRRPLWELHH